MTYHTKPHRLDKPIAIRGARAMPGRGRGKGLGIPTINIDLGAVPQSLTHGIYACRITLDARTYDAAMHFGPRPVFQDSLAFEVHIIDETIDTVPASADIDIIGYIRPVLNFPSPKALVDRIKKDIVVARGMLCA